ncbi:MAG: ABC transporter ATP-binding protein [Propioniciclava sp.]|uniref:ABC transporter ATP-binding protein n=1 Tax=Propioniciclava sp. TaxID=2038686 RepID=UPI0039E5F3C7
MAYPGPPAFTALRDVTLDIRTGERWVVIGPSGSGKSTLLNVLGLLERPTSGALWCRGRTVFGSGEDGGSLGDREMAALRAREFGFVFQSFHLVPDRTVRENVTLPMAVQRVDRRQRARRCEALIERVGLTSRADALAKHLSGGEKQRVAVARALTGDPGILLCDEPTGNLDSAASASVMDLLTQLNEQGTTVVLVTHDPRWAGWGQRVLQVTDGHARDDAPEG